MPSAYLQWRFHSGERVVARGPLVTFIICNPALSDAENIDINRILLNCGSFTLHVPAVTH